MLLNLRDPVANGLERSTVRHVVHKKDALGAAEIRRGDCAESLLARSVPNLELDSLAVHLDVLDFEVDADRGDEGGREGIVGVPEQQASLAHARVSDH